MAQKTVICFALLTLVAEIEVETSTENQFLKEKSALLNKG